MTDKQYGDFVERYRELRLGSLDYGFVVSWRPKLDNFAIEDLLAAVLDVTADLRAQFPNNDLPILLEHANARQSARERTLKTRKPWGKKPMPPESWDRRMLKLGAIDEAEFGRRQEARKESK